MKNFKNLKTFETFNKKPIVESNDVEEIEKELEELLSEEGVKENRRFRRSSKLNESLTLLSIAGLAAVIGSAIGWAKFTDDRQKKRFAEVVRAEAEKTGKSVEELEADTVFMSKVKKEVERKGILGDDWKGGGTRGKRSY
jgi:hypothetical protein